MTWFDRNNVNNETGGEQPPAKPVILTDEHYERIANDVVTRLQSKQGESISAALAENPILKRLNESMEAAEQARKQRQQQTTEQSRTAEQSQFEEAYNELEPQTRQVIDTRFSQLNDRSLRVEAREVRRSVFEDAENFPYYTGELKKKVDEMLDAEPVSSQVNPNVVRNAYKVVLADHITELQQNKLRSRLSGATGTSTGASLGTPDPNALPELTTDEKNWAEKMGIDTKEWAKSKKEMIESGEISGV